jgi:ABC-2 type transport system ATP-binding protein
MNSIQPILDMRQVTKSFRNARALDNFTLTLRAGDVYALLGPNGAGKTTTINLILGFLAPDSGEIRVEGRSVRDEPLLSRSRIAYLPEMVALYPALSGIENLRYFALLAGKELDDATCRHLLSDAGLQANAHERRAADYSKGMRQKVGVAIAKAKDAALLLLDEPTSGLDPSASTDFYAMVRELAGRGMAVLMTTHDLWRVHEAANRIGILRAGVLTDEIEAKTITATALEERYVRRQAA